MEKHKFEPCEMEDCAHTGEHCHFSWCGAPRNHPCHAVEAAALPDLDANETWAGIGDASASGPAASQVSEDVQGHLAKLASERYDRIPQLESEILEVKSTFNADRRISDSEMMQLLRRVNKEFEDELRELRPLRESHAALLPFAEWYANWFPKWTDLEGKEQDPNGVHEILARAKELQP